MSLEVYYIKRIVALNFFIQICLFITFSTIQAPGILMALNGLNIGKINFIILIILSILEWSNFLILLSLIFSMIWIVYNDFIVRDVKILFLQLGRSSKDLFRCLFLSTLCFGMFFFCNSLFFRPKINFTLRQYLLDTVKKSAFYMIDTHSILRTDFFPFLEDMNFSLSDRKENRLYGLLIHKEALDLILIIHELHFKKNNMLDIDISGIFIILEKFKIKMKCKEGVIVINPDAINFAKHVGLLEKFNFDEFFDLFKIFIITLFLSLWVYIIIFMKNWSIKVLVTIGYCLNLLNAVNLIYFDKIIFITILLVILANFIRIRRCSNF